MTRELITCWGDYQAAIDRLLPLAGEKIFIYDEDLNLLKLDARARLEELKRLLQTSRATTLQIAVRNAEPLRRQMPLLIHLLSTCQAQASARQTPGEIAHLRDSMIIIDGKHALIRFEQNLPRSKLLIDDPEAVRPYLNRFLEICSADGDLISGCTLGL